MILLNLQIKPIRYYNKQDQTQPSHMSILTISLQLVHTIIILRIFYVISTGTSCPISHMLAQLLLTLARATIEGKFKNKMTKFHILISFSLSYVLFPNKFKYLGWLFLFKTLQVNQNLKAIRYSCSLFGKDYQPFVYFRFLFDFVRFSINQYMVLGIFSAIYTFYCDQVHEPVPQPHKLMYQLVITASTIGYGDLTPRSKMQIIFFTYAIPILCGSFTVYVNNLVQIYTNTFLCDQNQGENLNNLDQTQKAQS